MSHYSFSQELGDLTSTFGFVERATTNDASRRQTQQENTGRAAVAEMTFVSTGSGQARIANVIRFPITFRREPHFTTGSAVILNPDPAVWHDPVGSAGIYQWARDADGNYVGAKLWVRVDMYPVSSLTTDIPPQTTKTRHFLTFSAFAIKDLPTQLLDDSLEPRFVDLVSADGSLSGLDPDD